MAKRTVAPSDNHTAELTKILRNVGYRHSLWRVFQDFVAMGAIALSNACDWQNREAREADYMKIVERYSVEDANDLGKAFAHVVMGLEGGMHDFLGSLYMNLELGDTWKGQYFTPYEVSRMMAMVSMGDPSEAIRNKGYVSVCDPCIGGGAMVIAAAHAMKDQGINYQQNMHAVGVDIDIVAVHMAYIQLSLLHVPAVLHHGNSLSLEVWSVWRTPAHILGRWDARIKRCADESFLVERCPDKTSLAEWGIGEVSKGTDCSSPALEESGGHGKEVLADQGAINLRAQLALFE